MARRKGRRFRPDTSTVVGEITQTLKADELWLLKKCCNDVDFDAWSRPPRSLLAAKPIAVGEKWKPPLADLKEDVAPESWAVEPLAAELELVSVADGVASIRGRASFGFTMPAEKVYVARPHSEQEQTLPAQKVTMPVRWALRIDTQSGLRVSKTVTATFSLKIQELTVKQVVRGGTATAFRPGTSTTWTTASRRPLSPPTVRIATERSST